MNIPVSAQNEPHFPITKTTFPKQPSENLAIHTKIENPLSPTLEVKSPTDPHEGNTLITKREENQARAPKSETMDFEELNRTKSRSFGSVFM